MNRRKVGIITLYGNHNYGNKLQNYAMQEVLKKYNCEPETILYTGLKKSLNDTYVLEGFIRPAKALKNRILYRIGFRKLQNKIQIALGKREDKSVLVDLRKEKEKNFKDFDKLIIKSDILPYTNNLKQINEKYDLFVFGSDQVWNPSFIVNYKFMLGLFAPKNKKISYAASIAVSDISDYSKKIYTYAFNDFDHNKISVREYQGADLIKELTGKEVKTVLDPTMLLSVKDWESVIKEPKNIPKKKFILTYILGDNSFERREFINQVAEQYDLEVINLCDIQSPELYVIGVGEFLWYLKNADIIFADSFHAGVFSILFEKPFYILNRIGTPINMNTRFQTLLDTFEIQDRFLEEYDIKLVNKNINYDKINKILEKRKDESIEFLKQALGEINE